ncbi:MAG: hypothetical protein M3155_08825, partial [Actinomycetota bacterium]|nr:hypothetical protein [Actinomycetota bacterium]
MTRIVARTAIATGLAAALGVLMPAAALAKGTDPAGGAPIGDIVWGTVVGGLLAGCVLVVGIAHRRGRIRWLSALGDFSARVSGFPAWYALPAAIAGISLIVAVTGFYWDVATHIDNGRDPGAFGNAAHFPILFGLGGIALAGIVAVLLGADQRDPAAVRLRSGWAVPLGGLLVLVCGAFALSGFPLDDVWHRLFGQDVTLWGPTHVLMIAGASLATLGLWVLLAEAARLRHQATPRDTADEPGTPSLVKMRRAFTAGGFLVGLSTLQGEFDYGVPQFQLVFQPILLMLAAGVGLVAARVYLGRGGALTAALFFIVLRGLITLLVGPVLGLSTLHFPLYLAEAGLVELAAWRLGTDRPVRLGVVSGVLIGTVGLAAEWGWSHVWMPLPWPGHVLGAAIAVAVPVAIAGGVIGAFAGGALALRADVSASRRGWVSALGAIAVIATVIATLVPTTVPAGARAQVTLTDSPAGTPTHRMVQATVRFSPAAVTHDAA